MGRLIIQQSATISVQSGRSSVRVVQGCVSVNCTAVYDKFCFGADVAYPAAVAAAFAKVGCRIVFYPCVFIDKNRTRPIINPAAVAGCRAF
ncbi:hypothetical protein Barb6_00448 [Bacteroidales bacterium Barb6]|nr:hypothetical protein Barb6_00448 [Bacteroidales bacterium Barb6]